MMQLEYITDGKRHLICRPYSIQNMHQMAMELNIKRCWFHSKGGNDHYDIPILQQRMVESKCTIVTTRQLIAIIQSAPALAPEFNFLLPPLPEHYDETLFFRQHKIELIMEYDNHTGQPKYVAYYQK